MDKNTDADLDQGIEPSVSVTKGDVERGFPQQELAITAKAESPESRASRPIMPREPSRTHSGHRPRSSSIDPNYIGELLTHSLTEFFKGSGQDVSDAVIKTIAEKFIQNSARIVQDEDSPYGRYTIDGMAIPGLFDSYDVGFDDIKFEDKAEAEEIADGVLEPPLRGTMVMDGTDVKVLVTQAANCDSGSPELVVKKKVSSQLLIETLFTAYNDKKSFNEANSFIQLGLRTSLGVHGDMWCHYLKKLPGILYAGVAMMIQMATPLLMITLLLFPDSAQLLHSNMDDMSARICPAQAGLLTTLTSVVSSGETAGILDSTGMRVWTFDKIIAKLVAGCCMVVMLGSTYMAFEKSTTAAKSYIRSYAYYSCCGYFDMLWSFILCFIVIPGASYVVFIQEPDRPDGTNQGKGHEAPMYMLMSLVAFGFLLEVPSYLTSLPLNDFSEEAAKRMIEYYLAYGEREIWGCCNWRITKWILWTFQGLLALIWISFTFVCFDMKLDLVSGLQSEAVNIAISQGASQDQADAIVGDLNQPGNG